MGPGERIGPPGSAHPRSRTVGTRGAALQGGGGLSFQQRPDDVPPPWPAGPGDQQMYVHLDGSGGRAQLVWPGGV
jgi:hypothetical protein